VPARGKYDAGAKATKGNGAGKGAGALGPAAAPPGRHRRAPAPEVRYLVGHQWPGGFQGEIQVVNHGARPIANWQAVVSLPEDTVTAIWNANGFVSNHILLLGPASATQVVPPGGGTLDVFFVASGPKTIPAACAFDGTLCA
jgi:chitin-binding protein